MFSYVNPYYTLEAGGDFALRYRTAETGTPLDIRWPSFEVDGCIFPAAPASLSLIDRRQLNDEIEQVTLCGMCGRLLLTVELRLCPHTPFVRWRYLLSSDAPAFLTKRNGEHVTYLSYESEAAARRTEVRLSEYDALTHAYRLRELPAFAHEDRLMGPILTERREKCAFLTAYEHGSMYPDLYLCYERQNGGIALGAVKGNYWDGQPLHLQPFEGVWLQLGGVPGDEDALAAAYRAFQLSFCSLNKESRKPYIFYNTWAFQERNRFYNGQEYLTSMNEARIDREIEIARRMGVDVFVIDTGWYRKTGDWETDGGRFPSGMKRIADRLAAYGMKLGLWFAPPAAACSSEMLRRHRADVRQKGGERPVPHPVWETEDSFDLCLVSDYWADFADRLIELAKTVGVRYFKWDAVDMFGCDCPGHLHGGERADARDRAENYSFRLAMYLAKAAERICAAVPDAIVDMDITEGGRSVGLGFLSAGKYFALNNGPYYPNYDISVPADQWINIFVNPGPARTWVCRRALGYDKWIPSVLFMAHYLPDDPAGSQLMNLASLLLGQNGVWGDLPAVSEAGIDLFAAVLSQYKQLRDDVTAADPVVYGTPGDLFEAHEKISKATGRGLVSLFANAAGTYRYRVASPAKGVPVIFGDAEVSREGESLWVELNVQAPAAAILFFPAREA